MLGLRVLSCLSPMLLICRDEQSCQRRVRVIRRGADQQELNRGATHDVERDGTQEGVENLGRGLVGLVEIAIEVLGVDGRLRRGRGHGHGLGLGLRGCGGGHGDGDGDGAAHISLALPLRGCGGVKVKRRTGVSLCRCVYMQVCMLLGMYARMCAHVHPCRRDKAQRYSSGCVCKHSVSTFIHIYDNSVIGRPRIEMEVLVLERVGGGGAGKHQTNSSNMGRKGTERDGEGMFKVGTKQQSDWQPGSLAA